jgi:hypothetical protein
MSERSGPECIRWFTFVIFAGCLFLAFYLFTYIHTGIVTPDDPTEYAGLIITIVIVIVCAMWSARKTINPY